MNIVLVVIAFAFQTTTLLAAEDLRHEGVETEEELIQPDGHSLRCEVKKLCGNGLYASCVGYTQCNIINNPPPGGVICDGQPVFCPY